jgi:hypothetical protein
MKNWILRLLAWLGIIISHFPYNAGRVKKQTLVIVTMAIKVLITMIFFYQSYEDRVFIAKLMRD